MKVFLLLLVFLVIGICCLGAIKADALIEAEHHTNLKFLQHYKFPSKNICTSRYSCLNCTTARICAPDSNGNFVEIQRFDCSGSTPYCDPSTGTCTENAMIQLSKSDNFTCLRDGYFPDGKNCSKFHLCKNFTSFTFECSTRNYYYNSLINSCTYNDGCYTFSCYGYHGKKIRYDRDNSIFAYCINNKPVVIDKCLGNDQLNTTSQKCEAVCTREGLIEDTKNCFSYYECTFVNRYKGIYSMVHKTCLPGEYYKPSEFQCVPLPNNTTTCVTF